MSVVPLRPRRIRSRALEKKPIVYSVRAARVEDYDALCVIFREGDILHHSVLPDIFRSIEGPARSKDYVSEALSSGDSSVFVAETRGVESQASADQPRRRPGGQVVGAIHVVVREAPVIPVMIERRFAVIDNIVVTRRFRRLGIGQALAERAHQWAREKGISQVELNVWEFNKGALAFYQKLGYRTASRRLRKSLA